MRVRIGSIADFHEDIDDDAVARALEAEGVADGRADRLDAQVVAAQDRRDGELARVAGVAEAVLEAAHGHVGQLADRVVDHLVVGGLQLGLGHAEQVAGGEAGEAEVEVEVDEAGDVPDEAHGADDLRPVGLGAGRGRRGMGAGIVQGFGDKLRLAGEHGPEHIVDRTMNVFADQLFGDFLDDGHRGRDVGLVGYRLIYAAI